MTPPDDPCWTFDTLKEYFDAQLAALKESTAAQFAATERALTKADAAVEKRFDSHNEFRGQLKDQANTFLPRAEAEQRFKKIEEQLHTANDMIKNTVAERRGRMTVAGPLWGIGIALITALVIAAGLAIFANVERAVPTVPAVPKR